MRRDQPRPPLAITVAATVAVGSETSDTQADASWIGEAELLNSWHGRVSSVAVSEASVPGDLWAAEAVHRANNLAQMTRALAALPAPASRRGIRLSPASVAAANLLATYYDGLGVLDAQEKASDCAPAVAGMAGALVTLFGRAVGTVDLITEVRPLALDPTRRRALLLATSELVVNALRHAFAGRDAGSIAVSLATDGGRSSLSVGDDGVGCGAGRGTGTSLLLGMAGVLGGSFERREAPRGGTVATLRFPVSGGEAAPIAIVIPTLPAPANRGDR